MSKLCLVLSILAAVSCGNDKKDKKPVSDVKWSINQVTDTRGNCADFMVEEKADRSTAVIFCTCIVEVASKRWAYPDFILHEDTYTDILIADGSVNACGNKAIYPNLLTRASK